MSSRIATTSVAPYQAPALEKGLDIVELLAGEPAGLTQNQVASRLGRSTGEIFRMLEVLVRRGYLTRAAADGSYTLTLRLFELAHQLAPVHRLLGAALPRMQSLARETRQSNHLVIHHDRRIMVLAQVDSPEAMGFSVRQGAHFPFRADRVSVRVMAAFQDAQRRRELIDEMIAEDPSPPARAPLVRRIEAIRRRGYEQHRSDTLPGITDICFPIVDRQGHAIATLTQPYLAQRDVTMSVVQARECQAAAVAAISRDLGAPAQ